MAPVKTLVASFLCWMAVVGESRRPPHATKSAYFTLHHVDPRDLKRMSSSERRIREWNSLETNPRLNSSILLEMAMDQLFSVGVVPQCFGIGPGSNLRNSLIQMIQENGEVPGFWCPELP